ncbi:hypothetical protein DID88_002952 [Monilinia fructigena]|uniref:Uncharacterized protein n=1 Tax=Monilinia fructigena TaxID=38457 RepID=A0A395IU61_9HELO|nr:hypothetical protein DID88_002952 [Monilinia fructigena]
MASSVDPQEGTSTNPLQGQDSGYPSLPRVPSLDVISYPDLAFAEEDAEREYEILKRKWRMGIRPEDMVEENVSEYAYFKVQEYEREDLYDEEIFEGFIESFKSFQKDDLKMISINYLYELRAVLRSCGVFVIKSQKGVNVQVSDALWHIMTSSYSEWSDKDIYEALHNKFTTFRSPSIIERIKSNPELLDRASYLQPSPRADTSDRASATRKTPSYGGLKTRLYARPMAARVFSGGRSPQVKQPPESARKPSRRRNPDLIPRTPTGSPRLQPSLFENRPAQTGRFPVNPTVVPPPPSDPSDSHHSSPEGSPRGPPRGPPGRRDHHEDHHETTTRTTTRTRGPPQRPPSGPPDGGDDPQGSEPDDRQPEKKDSNIGRDLSNLARRLYTDNEKYSSEDDRIALEFYHANLDRLPQTMNDMRLMFETTFEGDEYHRGIMRKWETVALSDVIRKNPDQSVLECFRLMTAELRELYRGLTGDFRTQSILHQKIINSCKDVKACSNALFRPSSEVTGLIEDIRASITTYEYTHPITSSTNFTDRRYRHSADTRSQPRRQFQPSQNAPKLTNTQCYVCKQEGCWSTKHSKEEQEESKRRFKEKTKMEGGRFERKFTQFLVEYEGDHSDDTDDELEIYNNEKFQGIVIDTGASKWSTVGYGQYQAYKKYVEDIEMDKKRAGVAKVAFGIGKTESIGSISINLPPGKVEFHVVTADTPFLLSLHDMDRLKVYYNNIKDSLVSLTGKHPVVRRFEHPILMWNLNMEQFLQESIQDGNCYLTDIEIRRLHRRFGHPSAYKFHRVLQRAGYDDIAQKDLDNLTKFCEHCQKHAKSPGRFKFNSFGTCVSSVKLPGDIEFEELDSWHTLIVADELSRIVRLRFGLLSAPPTDTIQAYTGVLWGLGGGNGIGVPPIVNFGTEEQRAKFLPGVADGSIKFCLGITEPDAGSDVANIKTTAIRKDGHYLVNGSKKWITNAIWADYVTAAVRTGGAGAAGISLLMLLIIPLKSDGVSRRIMHNSGVGASGSTFITFDDVKVPLENLLHKENRGFEVIMSNFNAMGRMIEPAQASLEQLTWLIELSRKSGGKNDVRIGGMTAMLKVVSTQCLEKCVREAQQVMGGLGYARGGKGGRIEAISMDVRVMAVEHPTW